MSTGTLLSSFNESGASTSDANTWSALQTFSAGVKITGGDLTLDALQKIYLDGGGDTYIVESAGNSISFFTAADETLRISANSLGIAASDRIYLDGVDQLGDTYFEETSANQVDWTIGGVNVMSSTDTKVEMKSVNLEIDATKNFYLDGGSNTYITEAGADDLRIYVGGVNMLQLLETTTDTVYVLNSNLSVPANRDLFLDGGSDTLINGGDTSNLIKLQAGGVEAFGVNVSGAGVAATGHLYLDGINGAGDTYFQELSADLVELIVGGQYGFRCEEIGGDTNLVVGQASINATTQTSGYLYIPSCAGTPTGAPVSHSGKTALVYDSTNNILYANDGGGWVAAN